MALRLWALAAKALAAPSPGRPLKSIALRSVEAQALGQYLAVTVRIHDTSLISARILLCIREKPGFSVVSRSDFRPEQCLFNRQPFSYSGTVPAGSSRPQVSAADALEELDGGVARYVSTDGALISSSSLQAPDPTSGGGLQRGQVTEIWGPPGSGKTALGCPSLPHLIALLCRPTAATVPANSAVVVIDSLSALVNHVFPKAPDGRKDQSRGKGQLSWTRSKLSTHIMQTGLVGVQYDTSQPSVFLPTAPRAKRKLAEAGLEVPDSEEDDEEYGWAREDESALPGPPPQWQGSEDILLGTQAAESEDDRGSNGDGHGDGGDGDDEDDEAEDVGEAATSGRDDQVLAEQ
ncbi:hypothetical protein BDP67DRAFT_489791 [Colletotrichum lupini]|nr:hypothetical protein BDP67DRAFT_489791 [Colletotrichum lupini]